MPKADDKDHSLDVTKEPGHHVVSEGTYCGTYETVEDAQAFIDGHLAPQGKDASIVSVE